MSGGSKPDYRIAALDKVTNEKQNRIGAAWKNPDGSVTIVFDPFVKVPVGRDFVITAFPVDQDGKYSPKGDVERSVSRPVKKNYNLDDDEIPF